jgi:hypothetical protein
MEAPKWGGRIGSQLRAITFYHNNLRFQHGKPYPGGQMPVFLKVS